MKRLLILALSAVILAACGTSATQPEAPKRDAQSGSSTDPNAGAGTIRPPTDVGGVELDPPAGLKLSVFFDLDSFVIKDEFRPVVEGHAAFLKRNPQRKVVIEGNTDERGSREYNLALGQKRAEAVKSMLRVLGVSEAQIEAVSFGEERPKATGHDETAYSENRRSDFSYRK